MFFNIQILSNAVKITNEGLNIWILDQKPVCGDDCITFAHEVVPGLCYKITKYRNKYETQNLDRLCRFSCRIH